METSKWRKQCFTCCQRIQATVAPETHAQLPSVNRSEHVADPRTRRCSRLPRTLCVVGIEVLARHHQNLTALLSNDGFQSPPLALHTPLTDIPTTRKQGHFQPPSPQYPQQRNPACLLLRLWPWMCFLGHTSIRTSADSCFRIAAVSMQTTDSCITGLQPARPWLAAP